MAKRNTFVGMDVHKESIDISVADEGRHGEIRHYWVIMGDLRALAKSLRALRAPNRRLHFVYEAGPCGFGIHRYLASRLCLEPFTFPVPDQTAPRLRVNRGNHRGYCQVEENSVD